MSLHSPETRPQLPSEPLEALGTQRSVFCANQRTPAPQSTGCCRGHCHRWGTAWGGPLDSTNETLLFFLGKSLLLSWARGSSHLPVVPPKLCPWLP